MNKVIRLVVHNESYWGKGLIYTQNIMPLKKLAENTGCKIELYSFTSIVLLFTKRKRIKAFTDEMAGEGIAVKNMPVFCYPTRLLLLRFFLIPFFYLNVAPYVLFLRYKDKNKDVVYNLRSYASSLAFHTFYGNKDKLVFDPRTDWVEENVNAGNFKPEGLTVKFWNNKFGEFVNHFRKTILISDIFKNNVVNKYNVENQERLVILYNPIDFKNFKVDRVNHTGDYYLYTGSFGHWNRLEYYLDFFKAIYERDTNSRMVICTSTDRTKVNSVLLCEEYNTIRDAVSVQYNIPLYELPKYYSQCDYGLQLMNKVDSRVGVKYVEYLAAGITPIVNDNVQGAAYIARKYNLGIVLDSKMGFEFAYDSIHNSNRIDVNSKEYKEFQKVSDLGYIVPKLKEIYF